MLIHISLVAKEKQSESVIYLYLFIVIIYSINIQNRYHETNDY